MRIQRKYWIPDQVRNDNDGEWTRLDVNVQAGTSYRNGCLWPDRTSGRSAVLDRMSRGMTRHRLVSFGVTGCPRAAGTPKGVAEEHPLAWAGERSSKQIGNARGAEHPLRKAFDMEYFGWNAFNHGFQIKSGMTWGVIPSGVWVAFAVWKLLIGGESIIGIQHHSRSLIGQAAPQHTHYTNR